jgi:hypothetical protein
MISFNFEAAHEWISKNALTGALTKYPVDIGVTRARIGEMKVHRIDHVGIVVNDLPAAKAFFLVLGLEMMGEGEVEGEWAERIIGLQDVKAEVIMLRTPDGETNIELSKFHSPTDENGIQRSLAKPILLDQSSTACTNMWSRPRSKPRPGKNPPSSEKTWWKKSPN